MNEFLQSTDVIDWQHPGVIARTQLLASSSEGPMEIARRCFEWVRDEIKHSHDHGLQPVTCAASEVLRVGSGFCYAKSHLLAALLRANGIPTALCYQRLSCNDEGTVFCLHGLNAVHLPEFGWYRIDARGNRSDVDAQIHSAAGTAGVSTQRARRSGCSRFLRRTAAGSCCRAQIACDSRRTLGAFA